MTKNLQQLSCQIMLLLPEFGAHYETTEGNFGMMRKHYFSMILKHFTLAHTIAALTLIVEW